MVKHKKKKAFNAVGVDPFDSQGDWSSFVCVAKKKKNAEVPKSEPPLPPERPSPPAFFFKIQQKKDTKKYKTWGEEREEGGTGIGYQNPPYPCACVWGRERERGARGLEILK